MGFLRNWVMSDFLPDGWGLSRMAEISRVVDSAHQTPSFSVTGYPMVRVGDIKGGKISLENTKYVSHDVFKVFTKNYIPTFDDLLMTRVGSYGRCSIVKSTRAFCLGQNTVVINPNPVSVNSDYLYQFLQTENINNQIEDTVGGSSQKSLSLAAIKILKILTPRLPEQQKIANILTSVDQVIEKTQAQIDKLKDLKTSMMQELLTKGIGHSEFKDSAVGRIPVGWEVSPIGKVCDLQVGYAFKSACFVSNGVKLLRGDNVGFGMPTWERIKCLSNKDALKYSSYSLDIGDIIIGMDRTFTKSGIKITKLGKTDVPALLVQRVGRFLSTKLDKAYLWQLVRSGSFTDALKNQEKGMDIPHLSKSEILEPLVAVPPIKEQQEIAKILANVDKAIIAKVEKLKATNSIKKALMQDLLTGKVRVKVDKE